MAVYFLDSSALVKRYRQEAGSEQVLALMDNGERLVIARLAHVEVAAPIMRRGRAATISQSDLEAALSILERDVRDSFDLVELDSPVLERAVAMTRTHALRGADAIQLACALFARDDAAGVEFAVVGSDKELNEAAAAEDLTVLDPTA
jgi:uncharacterized protein